jgi:3-oxoacyl-[acyl-carrier protein] reductase
MRKVIVTGGSRGLGLAIVQRLVCEGYCAIVVARRMNDLFTGTVLTVDAGSTA